MPNAIVSVPPPRNEPILAYAPGSPERKALRAQLAKMSSDVVEITPRIGGRGVATGRTAEVVMPHDHRHVLAVWHKGGAAEVAHAIDAALVAHREWSRMAWRDRAAIFLRAADLLAGPRSEEHTSELQSHSELVCRLPLEKKKEGLSSSLWFH